MDHEFNLADFMSAETAVLELNFRIKGNCITNRVGSEKNYSVCIKSISPTLRSLLTTIFDFSIGSES